MGKKTPPPQKKYTNISQTAVRKLEAEQRPVQIQSGPQRMVQPEACDKNTDTPLELFAT